MKSFFVMIVAILSIIYMLNPGFGWIELLPDNLPFIGNLDEATAMAVLIACARYFGYDLSEFLGRKKDSDTEVTPKARVIDVDKI
ncbi:MAG: DUF1232 domain-containing protein [Akkermansiaceae bacterium]